MISRSGCSRWGSIWAHTSSSAAAYTGKARYRSRPMPGRCEPCPVNRKAVRPAGPGRPVTTTGDGRPSARAVSPARKSSGPPTSTARWSKAVRVVSSAWPTSAASRSHAAAVISCAARALSASSVLPDSSQGSTSQAGADGASRSASGSVPEPAAGGASSTITCALVPLSPNDETAARRGVSPVHGRSSVRRLTAPSSQSTWVDGLSTCSVAGMIPWRIASTVLMTPATPAAAWVCPMLDLTEPSHRGRSAGRSRP